jgi:hypothetical protein
MIPPKLKEKCESPSETFFFDFRGPTSVNFWLGRDYHQLMRSHLRLGLAGAMCSLCRFPLVHEPIGKWVLKEKKTLGKSNIHNIQQKRLPRPSHLFQLPWIIISRDDQNQQLSSSQEGCVGLVLSQVITQSMGWLTITKRLYFSTWGMHGDMVPLNLRMCMTISIGGV